MKRTPDDTTLRAQDAVAAFSGHRPLRVRYARDELICQNGSYAAGLYLIRYGLVDESIQDPRVSSETARHNVLCSRDVIGLEVFLEPKEELHQTSCRALTDTELLFIERSALAEALMNDRTLNRHILAALASRHFAVQRSSWRQSAPPRERICSLLLDLVASAGHRDASEDGAYRLPRELTPRMVSQLADLSLRQLRATCEALSGVRWDRKGDLVVWPAQLLDGEIEGSAL